MRKLLVVVVALVVMTGCGGEDRAEQAAPSPPSSTSASPITSPALPVSTAAPGRTYVLKGRLHVGEQVLPGRFYSVTARGDAWITDSGRESAFWGVGTTAHRLPAGDRGWLSTDGRYLLTASPWEDCGDDDVEPACALRLLDTTGQEPTRHLVMRRPIEVVGVTNQGVVVLTESAARRWDELVWDAASGDATVKTLVDSPPMREWAMQGWEPREFGPAGFEFNAGNVPGRWLGEIVDGELRPRLRLPDYTEPGPGGTWALGTRWLDVRPPAAQGLATTRTLRAWRVKGSGTPVQLRAPRGWSFAQAAAGASAVFWEDPDTFLALVVDSRMGGDRLARCVIPRAFCVILEG